MAQKKTGGVFFGAGGEFGKAYPMLADAVLIYEEFDFSGLVRAGVHSLRRQGHVVACSNSHCHEGGYDLRSEIETMMSVVPRRTKPVHLQCEGWETKPRQSFGNICTGSIEGTLELHMKKVLGQRNKKVLILRSAAA